MIGLEFHGGTSLSFGVGFTFPLDSLLLCLYDTPKTRILQDGNFNKIKYSLSCKREKRVRFRRLRLTPHFSCDILELLGRSEDCPFLMEQIRGELS